MGKCSRAEDTETFVTSWWTGRDHMNERCYTNGRCFEIHDTFIQTVSTLENWLWCRRWKSWCGWWAESWLCWWWWAWRGSTFMNETGCGSRCSASSLRSKWRRTTRNLRETIKRVFEMTRTHRRGDTAARITLWTRIYAISRWRLLRAHWSRSWSAGMPCFWSSSGISSYDNHNHW